MYYPNADEENSELCIEFGKFRINYLSELTFENFAIRTLELENVEVRKTFLFKFFFSSKNKYIFNQSKKRNALFTIATTRIGQTLANPSTQHRF